MRQNRKNGVFFAVLPQKGVIRFGIFW